MKAAQLLLYKIRPQPSLPKKLLRQHRRKLQTAPTPLFPDKTDKTVLMEPFPDKTAATVATA